MVCGQQLHACAVLPRSGTKNGGETQALIKDSSARGATFSTVEIPLVCHVCLTSEEWMYAFDIHCNSFFPFFLVLYVAALADAMNLYKFHGDDHGFFGATFRSCIIFCCLCCCRARGWPPPSVWNPSDGRSATVGVDSNSRSVAGD